MRQLMDEFSTIPETCPRGCASCTEVCIGQLQQAHGKCSVQHADIRHVSVEDRCDKIMCNARLPDSKVKLSWGANHSELSCSFLTTYWHLKEISSVTGGPGCQSQIERI